MLIVGAFLCILYFNQLLSMLPGRLIGNRDLSLRSQDKVWRL